MKIKHKKEKTKLACGLTHAVEADRWILCAEWMRTKLFYHRLCLSLFLLYLASSARLVFAASQCILVAAGLHS